ncbi:MAG: hypothetical protein AAFQ77_03830 [Myxococcota bacterium]
MTWRIPKAYTADELQRMLDSLPVTFEKVGLFHSFDVYESLQNSGSCVFTVREVLPDLAQGPRDG